MTKSFPKCQNNVVISSTVDKFGLSSKIFIYIPRKGYQIHVYLIYIYIEKIWSPKLKLTIFEILTQENFPLLGKHIPFVLVYSLFGVLIDEPF